MILCRKCGHENADDASFCGQCNAFLEWSGQRVASPGAPPASSAPSPPVMGPPAQPSTPVVNAGPTPAPAPLPPPTAAVPVPTPPVPTQPASRPPSAVPDAPPPRRPTTAPADQPRSRQPTAQQPPPRPRPESRPAAEEPAIKAGDRICPTCGIGNDPARRFCRRCGASLEQAVVAVPVPVPWYRRLFRRGSPDRFQAGERPRSMAERGRPRRSILGIVLPLAVVVAVVAAVGAYVGVPDVRSQVERAVADVKRQLMPELADVHPGASNDAVDDDTASWWTGAGEEPDMTLRFRPAVDLGGLVVHGGANAAEFLEFRRPLRLRLETGDRSVTVDLADTSDPQTMRIDLRDVSRLRVIVEEATGTPRGAPVAIRELEFKEVR